VSAIQRLAQSCRCSGQLTGGTARLTGKMTCGGSGPGGAPNEAAATVARRCHRKKSLKRPGDSSV
jgi:hypothetical protein